MEQVFEREPLYEEVWSTPLTRLGEKYGLSDNGIRKICKAMNIPLPQAGHWARVAAGKTMIQPALPKHADRVRFVSNVAAKADLSADDIADAAWITAHERFERDATNVIVVPTEIKKWHAILREIRPHVLTAAKTAEKLTHEWQRHEAEKLLVRKGPPRPFHAWQAGHFVYDGQLLPTSNHAVPLRVSLLGYERALRLLQAVINAAEDRGMAATLDKSGSRLNLALEGTEVTVRVSERLERKARPESKKDEEPYRHRKNEERLPTGELRFHVGEYYSETQVSDRANKPLEEYLNEVLIRVFRKVAQARQRARQAVAREKQWAAERKAREEQEARRQEMLRLAAEEAARRRSLVNDAKAWQEAKLVREYLEAIRSAAGRGASEESAEALQRWLDWADGVVSEMDPMNSSVHYSSVDTSSGLVALAPERR